MSRLASEELQIEVTELLDPVVLRVGYVDVVPSINRHAVRPVKLTGSATF